MASYATDTYANLKERFKMIAGLSSLETTDAAFLRDAVNKRIRDMYERWPWSDHTIIGEAVTITGLSNEIDIYGGAPDIANQSDTVFKVHQDDPLSTRHPREYLFAQSRSAAGVPSIKILEPTTLTGTVYVTYRIALEDIISDGGTYTSGYWGDEANDNPNIPYQFFEYSVHGAYADFLRGDGQNQKAQVEDQNAERLMRMELNKQRDQSRGYRHDILQYRPVSQFRRHNASAGGAPVNQTAAGMLDNETT